MGTVKRQAVSLGLGSSLWSPEIWVLVKGECLHVFAQSRVVLEKDKYYETRAGCGSEGLWDNVDFVFQALLGMKGTGHGKSFGK